jgi:hypothetical protein
MSALLVNSPPAPSLLRKEGVLFLSLFQPSLREAERWSRTKCRGMSKGRGGYEVGQDSPKNIFINFCNKNNSPAS